MLDPIKITQELIRCPSVTPNEAGSLDVLEKYLKEMGFDIHRMTFSEDGYEDVQNLYAEIGSGSPHLCLAGHLDVVPTGDESLWTHPPFGAEIVDGHLYGRGAADMKSGVAAFISAVYEFLQQPFKGTISFAITLDEESVAINGTPKLLKWMKENNKKPDACLLSEPSCPDVFGESYRMGRRGTMTTRLTVHGVQGHIAYPDKTDNPITRLTNIVKELKDTRLDDGNDFFPPSNLEVTGFYTDNKAENVIPSSANIMFNIRYNTEHTKESLQEWITSVVKKYAQDYDMSFHPNGDPFIAPKDSSLVKAIEAGVSKVLGSVPKADTGGGTSDGRFIKDICSVAEFGIVAATNHQIDEHVKVEDIQKLHHCFVAIFKEFFA
ncbi:MAG: succinyl-diaminopimelate desuccinylase [Alphaproteobacteria bacterium]